MIEKLAEIHLSLAREIGKLSYKRYLFNKIRWDSPLIGITGARGVGKTTLLLQYYLSDFRDPERCLYLSADNINVVNRGLYNLAEEFFRLGGEVLLIDEVHKYPGWQMELKNIYDSFPKKRLIFSGSSSIGILKGRADLSRRAVFYDLKGLSFREFLILYLDVWFEPVGFEDLLVNHVKLADRVGSKIPVLKYFRDYLKFGYYPFFKEGVDLFYNKLNNVVEKIICEDIPSLFNIRYSTVHNLKRLLYLVATSQPFTPNVSRLSSQLGISKEYIYNYLDELQRAGLFSLLYPRLKGLKLVRKPQKIYLENTNLFYLVEGEKGFSVEKGSIRETFFINQSANAVKLYFSQTADFVDGKGRNFEVGGRKKEKGVPVHNYFIVKDDIITGFKNSIPLWLFGFVY